MENIRVATLFQIVYLRKKANLSQVEMAIKMEMTQSSYARFETGKSKTDLSDLSNFCKCLNLSLREFFEFSDSLHLCK